jgi:tRNA A-37 threonylcarbamoyl transferase component Bud32/tetratricopeptide (TPR) repeat protein
MNLDRIGKYRVVGRIGQGAMGEVYKAHDPLLNRYVALKTIHPSLASDAHFKERFRREAQSAARLNHPNIVTVFDFGDEAGVTYMAMELLEGLDLREAIRRRSLGLLGRKLDVLEQLCEGLGFAHAQGVVHRDLKPGNVHLQPSGLVKILDFGLARLGPSDMTRTGTVMGTPHYMSPEQVRGERADPRSDVFSLGAIAYEVLSGRRAFDGRTTAEVLQAITGREPEPLSRLVPDLPESIAHVVGRSLAKDAAGRFPDARRLGEALSRARDALSGETLPGREAGGEPDRTLLTGAGATIVLPAASRGPRSVAGANALDLDNAGAVDGTAHDGTERPDATVAAGPETDVARGHRGLVLGASAVLVVAALAGTGVWLRSRATAPAGGAEVERETVGILTETLLMSKVELARADLDRRNYSAAADRAREALAIDPAYAEAREILDRAEAARGELEAAAEQASAAFERGDTALASEALGRVLALDPRHPVANRLSGELNRHFRGRAEEARAQAANARAAAEAARASADPDFARARTLAAEAGTLFGREEYAVAAQKYLEARNAFDLVRTAAEARRALPSPVPRLAAATPLPSPTAASRATPAPTAAPTTAVPVAPAPVLPNAPPPRLAGPAVVPPAAATAPAVPAPPPAVDGRLAEVDRVLAGYERAYETLDVSALRSVMDLTQEQDSGLREAFKAFKSYDVEMADRSVAFEGDGRARVRVTRQDTVNGRRQPPKTQVFVLAREGGAWRIVSFAFER